MSKLIVVDDNELDRRIIEFNLVKHSIFENVAYYDEGRPLIEFLIEHKSNTERLPDAIFLDLRMPDFDGWDVLEAMKEIYSSLKKDIAVYIVTASISLQDRFRAMNYSFVSRFISKPITKEILISIYAGMHNQSA
jgi:CheY-like chemotaxis protein